ncbi:hypothetical protein ABE205_19430 [Brevibacillus agri]|uniref:hypothetical protein n=1 Tax=Brevibacillus agri TaxID=51101 RepID=UPI001C8E7820|nr:hypothetical protein [Brevibacillus agri]MBY0052303.1 hypothetical protein [Brevibacillus agri]
MVEVLKMPKYPCSFCKKNEATQFCDFVIGYAWTSAKDEKGRMIGGYHETCDNEICKECATTVHGGFDFCPSCNKLREMIEKQHDKRGGRMMKDIVFGRYEG